jgi:hypothetical protein
MTASIISLDDPTPVRAVIDAYLDGRGELTGLDLYYALERATSLLSFHTMLRGGPRNRERNGLQQSYGDHNRLLMLGLDRLVAGDLDWYRERLDPTDPVPDDALRRCFASVASLDLPREVLVAFWLAAALHDCGMLCGRGAYVDVEDGVPLSRPIIEALGPSELHDLATFALHHHDYIKGVFLGEVPAALVADDLVRLPESQRRVALAALGCVQVAGAASLGEGRLGPQRVEIFDRCFDGTALDDRTRSTRVARLLGTGTGADADVALAPALDGFLDSAAVHGWQRVTGRLRLADRTALIGQVATWWTESDADHVVFADGVDAWTAVTDLERVPRHVETTMSGVTVLVVDG